MEKFNRTLRGYDPEEVNSFLDKVIGQVEQMVNDIKVKDSKINELQKLEVENQNFIRNLEEYLYELEKKRKSGDIVIGYWQIKKLIGEVIEQCKIN